MALDLKYAFQTDFPRRDNNMKVEVVMKYLAEKLGIARSHQVRVHLYITWISTIHKPRNYSLFRVRLARQQPSVLRSIRRSSRACLYSVEESNYQVFFDKSNDRITMLERRICR
jgi:hypothetical protein